MFPLQAMDDKAPAAGNSRISFHQPRFSDIRDSGYTCVDMHTHTVYSDSGITVAGLLTRAEQLGIGIAITDHNEIGGVIEAYEAASSVPVIPGIEVSALDGPHLLIYFSTVPARADFFERYVKDARQESPFMAIRLSTEEIVTRAEQYDCLKVAAHPYGYAVINRGLLKCVDKGLLPHAARSLRCNGSYLRGDDPYPEPPGDCICRGKNVWYHGRIGRPLSFCGRICGHLLSLIYDRGISFWYTGTEKPCCRNRDQ